AGRRHADLRQIIGMFVNTLPIRSNPSGEKTFRTYLAEIKEQTLGAFENQEYQFEDIVEKIALRRDTGRNPIFDVMLTLQNQADFVDAMENETGEPADKIIHTGQGISKFDITLTILEIGGGLHLTFEYCTKLFKPETIERFVHYMKNLVTALKGDDTVKLGEMTILPEEEKQKLLYDFNDTAADIPRDKTVHGIFEDQVKKTPDALAVVGAIHGSPLPYPAAVTYRELNERANRMASRLIAKGVKPGAIVALMMGRSLDLITTIMAILKAGGVYMPIDAEYPEERIDYILADSAARIMVTTRTLSQNLSFDKTLLYTEELGELNELEELKELKDLKESGAYVIYT
ncbi:MAG: AMP-binding protein, partial [bacterium]|nr:AMP-binding protein [bacterium]